MGALFGGGPKAPPPPPPPLPMPDPGDPLIMAAQRKRTRTRLEESGLQSTMLTGRTDDYSGDKLGSR